MKWLSRGLFEALTSFIGWPPAKTRDYKLRAMLYEFHYRPVGKAFKEATQGRGRCRHSLRGASRTRANEEMIADAAIKRLCEPQKSRAGIRHNKFIVLIHKACLWPCGPAPRTFPPGGILGHSNVGHAIWDEELASVSRILGTP